MKKVKVLHPSYYTRFGCIGPDCEIPCCQDWEISIDKSTYMLYRNIRDTEFAKCMRNSLKRNKSNADGGRRYAKFILNDKNFCPFYRDDKLCAIQAKFGHNYLSRTCQSYPRIVGQHDGILRVAMTTSCPEVVRVALFPKEPMSFVTSEFDVNDINAVLKMPLKEASLGGESKNLAHHVITIQNACIDILQCRETPLRDRLLAVGMMLKKVTEMGNDSQAHEVPEVVASYVRMAKAGQFVEVLDTFNDNIEMREEMLSYLANYTVSSLAKQGDRYVVFKTFFSSLVKWSISTGVDNFNSSSYFKLASAMTEKYWQTFLDSYEHVLENYFVNLIFLYFYPFCYSELTLYQHFIILAEQFAMFRMLLCVCAEEFEGFTEDLIINAIAALSIDTLHNSSAKNIAEVYQNSGKGSLAHISFLIR